VLHVVEDDFLFAQARQVVGPFPGGRRDRAKAMLKERDLQAGVCEDATTMPLDDSDSVRISIAHKPAREDPDRDPRRRAVDESRDCLQFLRGKLRGPETDQVGLRSVGVGALRADQIIASDRKRLEALDARPARLGRHALQVEHPARAGGGERRSQPLEVLLRAAKAAEEWEAVACLLDGAYTGQ